MALGLSSGMPAINYSLPPPEHIDPSSPTTDNSGARVLQKENGISQLETWVAWCDGKFAKSGARMA
ncbi:MAG TPA: hypothetical protein VF447_13545 [Terriglobales bacterium]